MGYPMQWNPQANFNINVKVVTDEILSPNHTGHKHVRVTNAHTSRGVHP